MELLHIDESSISCELTDVTSLPKKGYLWLLLERNEPFDLTAWLANFGRELNPRHLEDIKQVNHPSFYEGMKDYDVLILRSLSNRKDDGHRRIFNSTTFIIYKDLLITVYDQDNISIPKFLNMFTDEKRTPPEDPATLVEFCVDHFIYQFLDTKQAIDNRLNSWQKKLLQTRNRSQQDWMGLLDFKTDVRRIKMLCEEQLDTINLWRSSLRSEVHKSHGHDYQLAINLNDLAEHSNRMVKLTTQSQQELDSLLQLYFTILSHRTNEIMRVVALITGIFLPANLITGIFGMNFTSIPDLTRPHAFTITIVAIIGISAGLLSFFRWRKWL